MTMAAASRPGPDRRRPSDRREWRYGAHCALTKTVLKSESQCSVAKRPTTSLKSPESDSNPGRRYGAHCALTKTVLKSESQCSVAKRPTTNLKSPESDSNPGLTISGSPGESDTRPTQRPEAQAGTRQWQAGVKFAVTLSLIENPRV